jgi:chloramphenicol-sensitive protein RarD
MSADLRASDSADLERRRGVLAGVAAYSLWGVFPLYFRLLDTVEPAEILLHRVVWSFVVVMALLAAQGDRHWFAEVRRTPGAFPRLAVAGVLVATNWLVYIWAVNNGHVVEGALGYYINPLLTVGLGVFVLGEHLSRMQQVALGFGAASVGVLTVGYGRVPWIALVLAASFAGYGFLKKSAAIAATRSLAVETSVLVPVAVLAMLVLHGSGEAEFTNGSVGRDVLLVGLGMVTAVPLLLFGSAARRIPLSLLGLLQYLTPTLQLVCGVLILGEEMPPVRLAGFVLVWIALGLLAVDAIGRSRRQQAEVVAELT